MKRSHTFKVILLILLILALTFEVIRDALTKNGDFGGYIYVGNLVMDGLNIYTDPLINTWPPFFAILTVPLSIFDNFNPYLCRFTWLFLSVVAMVQIISITTRLILHKELSFSIFKVKDKISQTDIQITHWLILVPVLITLRYLLDNLSNIQINVFILLLTTLSIFFFSKGKNRIAALFLALGISIKVYPIFLFLYFVVKREYSIVLFTLLFCVVFACVPFLVFGYDQTLVYYEFWYHNNVVPFASVAHKNQSYFSMMRSLLTHESPGLNQPLNKEIYMNVVNLSLQQVKIISYALVASIGAGVVFLFRDKLVVKNNLKASLEYVFILTIIPILSPLAWKAYFIFLFAGYFVNYLFLFEFKNSLKKGLRLYILTAYYASIILTVFSSELFVGKYFSDVLEAYSCIVIGTILLASNLLIFYFKFDKFHGKLIS